MHDFDFWMTSLYTGWPPREVGQHFHPGFAMKSPVGELLLFPTCQVRAVRFYVRRRPPPSPPPLHPPPPPRPQRSGWQCSASSAWQCSPPDLNPGVQLTCVFPV